MARTRKPAAGTDPEAKAAPTAPPDLPEEAPAPLPQDEVVLQPGPVEPGPAPAEPDPPPQPASATSPPVVRRGPGFLPLVLGGAVAGAIGFGAAMYLFPQGWRPAAPSADELALREAVQALPDRLSAAEAGLAALRADLDRGPDLSALTARIGALETAAPPAPDLSAVEQALAALEARLTELEKRPVEGGAASATALEAFEREMSAMRALLDQSRADTAATAGEIAAAAEEAEARIAAAEAEAARLRAEAEDAARRAAARAALSHVQAALESGAPMEAALAGLVAAGAEVPADLAREAAGAPSLAALREAFPEAARAALAASLREEAGSGTVMERVGTFLRSQTGARSLEPRAGDDPDAVLSRAEAALGAADVAGAVAELAALPEPGRAAMGDWLALAERRIRAMAAVATLAETLD